MTKAKKPAKRVARTRARASKNSSATWDVFLSYNTMDREIAERIKTALEKKGLSVWFSPDEVRPGDRFIRKMGEGLEHSSAVVVLVSPDSMNSGWVKEEYEQALTLSISATKEVRLIPVLVRSASVPPFLATRSWVDFRDGSHFDDRIEELVRGIRTEPVDKPSRSTRATKLLLSKLSFLWFFPEGMLSGLYTFLVSQRKIAAQAQLAEKQGLVLAIRTDGPELMGADPSRIKDLVPYLRDKDKITPALVTAAQTWIDEASLFSDVVRLGIGRILLIRDLLFMAQYLPAEQEVDVERRNEICQLARYWLPSIIEENHLRIGLEISKALSSVAEIMMPRDKLLHARILLSLGASEQAADILEAYRGKDLFGLPNLSKRDRFSFALDWAKASKDAGRAREMHADIVSAYGQMLELLAEVKVENSNDDDFETLEADILNNRASQLAQFGEEQEWIQARTDFQKAAKLFQSHGDTDKFTGTRANFVAQSLDRFDRQEIKPSKADLQNLLKSLVEVEKVADKEGPSESLFFFLYQKARLLKRLYPEQLQQAIHSYSLAQQVALNCGLGHRAPIAQAWVLRLRQRMNDISEEEYLRGLEDSTQALKAHHDDAWASRSLSNMLLDIAQVLRNRKQMKEAWDRASEAFELEARRAIGRNREVTKAGLRRILSVMNGVTLPNDVRAPFLKNNSRILKELTSAPGYQTVQWSHISDWLKQ